jgi:hypothetical protein
MFYDDKTAPGEFLAMTEIQRQVARYTSSLDEFTENGSPASLVYQFSREIDGIRTQYSNTWSNAAEINLQGAKLYLYASCLLSTDRQSLETMKSSDTAIFTHTILQMGHAAALRLITVMGNMGRGGMDNPPCSAPEEGGCPLLAHPKQHFRITFFACVFLLKYLDCNRLASTADIEAARNAVSTTYQLFVRFPSTPQIIGAAKNLEVLGRTIIPDQGRMVTIVKTRLGASLLYNAIWTAGYLRGRHNDPEFSTTVSTPSQPTDSLASTNELHSMTNSSTVAANLDVDSLLSEDLAPDFPWGVWDDALFDALGYDWYWQPGQDISRLGGAL